MSISTSASTINRASIVPQPTDTGAGVCIVENYLNKARTNRNFAAILVRNKYNNKYTIPSGTRDPGEDIEDTARRECKEETANLIRLPKQLMNGSYAVRHTHYRTGEGFVVYFVQLESPILSQYYQDNLTVLNENGADHDYLETDDFVRVYMNDLIADKVLTAQGDLSTKDANGNSILIEGRSKAVLREALKAGFLSKLPLYKPKLNQAFNNPSHPTLKGTKCYWL